MPRAARKRHSSCIYHIMIRSISELTLFKDKQDNDKYLKLVKKYQDIYLFKVYAYCLMGNHAHMVIDCCGADISKIMKSINQSYAAYYNFKYNRHGHVFQDRFKSKIVSRDEYLITLTAYIHNNPKDIKKYRDILHKYPYSSLGIYMGIAEDSFGILDYMHILSYFSNNIILARSSYMKMLTNTNISFTQLNQFKEADLIKDSYEYRSERSFILRDNSFQEVLDFLCSHLDVYFDPHVKFNRQNVELKSLYIIILRSLSNLSLKAICNHLSNVTLSNVYQLSEKGYELICKNDRYKNIIQNYIKQKSIA